MCWCAVKKLLTQSLTLRHPEWYSVPASLAVLSEWGITGHWDPNYICVCVLHIGFHLSASVVPPQSVTHGNTAVLTTPGDGSSTIGAYNVALVFDRRHITGCSCSCTSGAAWCAHVVALCLFRIHQVLSHWSAKYRKCSHRFNCLPFMNSLWLHHLHIS